MLFNCPCLVLFLSLSALTNGRPVDSDRNAPRLVQRAKSYAVVNVDGGYTPPPIPSPTMTPEKTETETRDITTSTSTPTTTPANKKPPTPKPSPTLTPAPTPSVVTIVVTATTGPVEYYDNGLWHTNYPVKKFDVVPSTTDTPSTSTPTSTPTCTSSAIST